MSNVVFGTAETSSGDYYDSTGGSHRRAALTIIGLQPQAITLEAGDSETIGGLRVHVRAAERVRRHRRAPRPQRLRSSGSARSPIVIGLMITFWVPRRRLWAKITEARTSLAGQAPSHANYTRDLRDLAREAGGDLPEETDDDD